MTDARPDHVPGERSTALYSPLAIACAADWKMLRVDSDGLGWISGLKPDLPTVTAGGSGQVNRGVRC